MSAKREGMARSWEVATRELPNFWERTQGKSWAEKVGQNKKLGREGEYGVLQCRRPPWDPHHPTTPPSLVTSVSFGLCTNAAPRKDAMSPRRAALRCATGSGSLSLSWSPYASAGRVRLLCGHLE